MSGHSGEEDRSGPEIEIDVEEFVGSLHLLENGDRNEKITAKISKETSRWHSCLEQSLIDHRLLEEYLLVLRLRRRKLVDGGSVIRVFYSLGQANAIKWFSTIVESGDFTISFTALLGRLIENGELSKASEVARHAMASGIPIPVKSENRWLEPDDLERSNWWEGIRPEYARFRKLMRSVTDGTLSVPDALQQFATTHSRSTRHQELTQLVVTRISEGHEQIGSLLPLIDFAGKDFQRYFLALPTMVRTVLIEKVQRDAEISKHLEFALMTPTEKNLSLLQDYLLGITSIPSDDVVRSIRALTRQDVVRLTKDKIAYPTASLADRGVDRLIQCYEVINYVPSEAWTFVFLKNLPAQTSPEVIIRYLDACERLGLKLNERHRDRIALAFLERSDLERAEDEIEKLWSSGFRADFAEIALIFKARSVGNSVYARRAVARLIANKSPRLDEKVLVVATRAHRASEATELLEFTRFVSAAGYSLSSRAGLHLAECLAESDMPEAIKQFMDPLPTSDRNRLSQMSIELICCFAERGSTRDAAETIKQILDDQMHDDMLELLEERLQILGDASLIQLLHSAKRPSTLDSKDESAESDFRVITTSITRRVRDPEIPIAVKNLYDGKCQICGESLMTATGWANEGAHIRPLGRPHFGRDLLENCLCLCPNHHKLLDGFGIYILENFQVADAFTDTVIGSLTTTEGHNVSHAALNYHRLLSQDAHSRRVNQSELSDPR